MRHSLTYPLRSWVEVHPESDFPIQNLPYGIFKTERHAPRVCTAIGDYVLDLSALAELRYFQDLRFDSSVFSRPVLNDFIALGRPVWEILRQRLQELLEIDNGALRNNTEGRAACLIPMAQVQLLMPLAVGNYTDFYSSEEHATNVGIMFRGKENALMPNWKHMPIAYHGRASSIVPGGVNIHRPMGQSMPEGATTPVFGPSRALDIELEMAFAIGKSTEMGQRLSTAEAEDHIFGLLLFNDWSARDIQKWEYQPLGPFLGKNFASSVSPWVVSLDALAPFRVSGRPQEPAVLPYLAFEGEKNYDIQLEVDLIAPGQEALRICNSNTKHLYWNMAQQLAHHTVGGCNLCIGDLMASGTISGPEAGSFGSLLELTWGGKNPIILPDGSERRYLQDGDTIVMRAYAQSGDLRVGFGEVRTTILPPR